MRKSAATTIRLRYYINMIDPIALFHHIFVLLRSFNSLIDTEDQGKALRE